VGAPGGATVGLGGTFQQQQQQQQEAVARLQQLPFNGPPIPQGHQMPGAPALGQGGQQPILNVSPAVSIADQAYTLS
jgi:paired amphipathic helix protein Sin3a